jgi:proteic killer suppression protein
MIKSFKHKGLELFYKTGNKKGIIPDHSKKVARTLDRLDASKNVQDMNLPGYKLHRLIGKKKDTWSVWVSGNWRITFMFEDEDAYIVDYRDYH